MFNIYYILLSFTIVNLTYFSSKNPELLKNTIYTYISNSKVLTADNDSDKSNESNDSNKYSEIIDDNIDSIKELTIKSITKSFNKKNIIKSPIYLELIDENELDYIPDNLMTEFNINNNLTDKYNHFSQLVLITFLNIKYIFIKLFYNNTNNKLLINNLYDFIKFYKNIIKNPSEYNNKINICLLFYNKHNKQSFYIKNKNLIKINNSIEYESICNNLKNNNIFIIKNNNKLILSYGEYLNLSINKNDIPKLFNNKVLSDGDYKNLFEYTNLTIIYWISKRL